MAVRRTTIHRPWVKAVSALAMVGFGAFLLKHYVFDVLAAAKRHDAVSLSLKGIFCAPMFLVVGLVSGALLMTGRSWDNQRFSDPQTRRPTAMGWTLLFAFTATGAVLYFWLRAQLSEYGYHGL